MQEIPNSKKDSKKKIWPFSYEKILGEFKNLPESLENCVEHYFNQEGKNLFQRVLNLLSTLKFSRVLFIGNTFNYYASSISKYVLLMSDVDISFTWESIEVTEFYDYFLPKEPDEWTLYIFISKSGKARLLKKSIEQLNILKINPDLIWLVTNNEEAPIASYCGQIFPTYVESEIVLSSRSFPHTVMVLYFISQLLLGNNPSSEATVKEIMKFISELKEYRKYSDQETQALINFIGDDFKIMYLISKGPASEASTKLLALNANSYLRKMCEGISLGLFFHGPFQIFERNRVDTHIRCVLIGAYEKNEKEDPNIQRLIELITQRAGRIVLICNNDQLLSSFKDNPLVLKIKYNTDIAALSPIFHSFIFSNVLLDLSLKLGIIQ